MVLNGGNEMPDPPFFVPDLVNLPDGYSKEAMLQIYGQCKAYGLEMVCLIMRVSCLMPHDTPASNSLHRLFTEGVIPKLPHGVTTDLAAAAPFDQPPADALASLDLDDSQPSTSTSRRSPRHRHQKSPRNSPYSRSEVNVTDPTPSTYSTPLYPVPRSPGFVSPVVVRPVRVRMGSSATIASVSVTDVPLDKYGRPGTSYNLGYPKPPQQVEYLRRLDGDNNTIEALASASSNWTLDSSEATSSEPTPHCGAGLRKKFGQVKKAVKRLVNPLLPRDDHKKGEGKNKRYGLRSAAAPSSSPSGANVFGGIRNFDVARAGTPVLPVDALSVASSFDPTFGHRTPTEAILDPRLFEGDTMTTFRGTPSSSMLATPPVAARAAPTRKRRANDEGVPQRTDFEVHALFVCPCGTCGRSYKTARGLHQHIALSSDAVHRTCTRVCDNIECRLICGNQTELREHKKRHVQPRGV